MNSLSQSFGTVLYEVRYNIQAITRINNKYFPFSYTQVILPIDDPQEPLSIDCPSLKFIIPNSHQQMGIPHSRESSETNKTKIEKRLLVVHKIFNEFDTNL